MNMFVRFELIPYSGKFSREKTLANFADFRPSAKVFSTKFGAWHTSRVI